MDETLRVVRGIVIRETKTRETRRLLTILTEDGGRIDAAAKSADRKNSKQGTAACQLLSYSEFTLFDYRGHVTINEAECLDMFREIHGDMHKLALAAYVCEVSARLSDVDFADDSVFRLTMNVIYAIARVDVPLAIIKAAFEARAAGLAGFAPELETCAACGKELFTPLLDVSLGESFCEDCGIKASSGNELHFLPYNAALAFRYVLLCDLKQLFRFTLDKQNLFSLCEAAESYARAQLGDFKTLAFYRKIAKDGAYI